MTIGQIEDRAGGPAIVGTRITVDDVLAYLLEPSMTEEAIGRLLSLTGDEVAATRAYILMNPDITLARHLQFEQRMDAAINPPEVVETARRAHESLLSFKTWLANREEAEASEVAKAGGDSNGFRSFRDWLAERDSRPASGN